MCYYPFVVIISLVIPSSDIIQIVGVSINSIFPLQGNFHFWAAKIRINQFFCI